MDVGRCSVVVSRFTGSTGQNIWWSVSVRADWRCSTSSGGRLRRAGGEGGNAGGSRALPFHAHGSRPLKPLLPSPALLFLPAASPFTSWLFPWVDCLSVYRVSVICIRR